jgi:hypothetical protein
MVIVRLNGGLGNQMFQYAAGRAVAHRRQVPLGLDTSEFQNGSQRNYRLSNFNIQASVSSNEIIESFKKEAERRSTLWLNRLRPYYRRPFIKEPGFAFDANILRAPGRVYLDGYWQSEKYFKEIERMLRSELTVSEKPQGPNAQMSERIKQTPAAVSLHVRRGDYVSNPVTNQYHGTCPLRYYEDAVAKLISLGVQPHLFVFSDDIPWAQANLRFDYLVTFVGHNPASADHEDLRLMSMCRHHIIANSSFSWWGAWLGVDPNKIVIAPREWFNDASHDTRDLIPDSWLQL